MGFDSYDAYLTLNGDTVKDNPVDYFKNQLQSLVNESFEVSSTYFKVKHRSRTSSMYLSATPTFTEVGVRMVRPYEIKQTGFLKDDMFNMIFKDFDYDVLLGDIFEFNNHMWMVINTSNLASVTNSVLVQRCNVKLKFTESEPLDEDIIFIDGIASKFITNSLKHEQFITLPDNKMNIQIPNNAVGEKIKFSEKGGTRFLLSSPYQNWKVISYDNISLNRTSNDGLIKSGIIKIGLELSELNKGEDDFVNGVAWQDYF